MRGPKPTGGFVLLKHLISIKPRNVRSVASFREYCSASPPDTGSARAAYEPSLCTPTSNVFKKGNEILHDPWYNKEERFLTDYYKGIETIPPEEVKTGGVTSEMAHRWKLLQELQDRNETLFYKVLIDHFVDMAPVVYTPTVGWVCLNYHKLYRRPRGMYFSAEDRGEMAAMAYNWPQPEVHAIVVTDGSRILGLGDLGVNGLGIPIGKLDLYCAAAGFSPARVLPCIVDVGTNNATLRADPLYTGLQTPRLTGPEYFAVMDEFVHAVMNRWPNAILQFEDFSIDHALALLDRYRNHHLVFNDDIQGTAATALAGMYGALRVLGRPMRDLAKQQIVVVGAGSAGMGVVRMLASGMEKQGLPADQAAKNFWVLDNHGLITIARDDLPPHVKPFARPEGDTEGQKLLEVIRRVKPTALLGLAGAGRLFTPEILQEVAKHCERPIVFPMSNPISRMECTSEDAIAHTQGRCVFASGSPQPDVEYQGTTLAASQANNMYIFPGLALGAFLGRSGIITDNMLMVAAEALPKMISEADLKAGRVYPRLDDIRSISADIAVEVIRCAAKEGRCHGQALERMLHSDARLRDWVMGSMFWPKYTSLVYQR